MKGKVVGPSFHFDETSIDFGKLAYGFLSSKTFSISNTSNIPMTYGLRIASDEDLDGVRKSEFAINPPYGTILPMDMQNFQVDFKPSQVGSYSTSLVVDVEAVGMNIQSIPITAESYVSEVKK
jgi:hydrocephalus-inducing protein